MEENGLQIVVRVSDDIRQIIRSNGDRLFLDFNAHHVTDRFYVKCCVACHRFGHYRGECKRSACCGYCASEEHVSTECPVKEANDVANYKCVNCEEAKKDCVGHSSHWQKCPTYVELQNKLKKNIPFYAKNGM